MNSIAKLSLVVVLTFSCGRDIVVGHPDSAGGSGMAGGSATAGGSGTGGGSGAAGGANQARIGVFRDGVWTRDANGDLAYEPATDRSFTFGQAGDRPVVGDWTGDGKMKIGVFRNANGTGYWSLDMNGNDTWDGPTVDREIYFGVGTDQPVVGDWTGSGVWRIGVYRPSDASWSLDIDGDGVWNASVDRTFTFGYSNSQAVAGDWLGTGPMHVGVMTPASPNNALWSLDVNGNGTWDQGVDRSVSFGLMNDLAIVGDWNGDGRTKLGTFRSGTWSFDRDGDNVYDSTATFGGAGDLPVAF